MPQAEQIPSIAPLPMPTRCNTKPSRAFEPGHSAEIVDLHDFFVKPPATNLQEAKERIFAELPPKPDCRGMSDFEMFEAMTDWNRMQLYVFQTVVFG